MNSAGMGGIMAGEPDIIIVGGGIVGCAAAYELARAGASCCLLDSGEIGREASWASVGLVTHPLPRRSPF
ncbi:MAG TPA: FAD-dependent oxidoreductase, partial [Desulfobacterales bacterium]|nr:FAD-dependent oxidoreductase [Desulfobacterales bacterium]